MFPTDTEFETEVTLETNLQQADDDLPFRILFLGDWSGRDSRLSKPESLNLRPIEIDRDNFDDVIKKLKVSLDLNFQGDTENSLVLKFQELDDFHPDQIFQQLPLFADLRDVRRKLLNTNTFNEAANEVRSWLTNNETSNESSFEKEESLPEVNQSMSPDLLDQILNQTDENTSDSQSKTAEKSELSRFISKLVDPYLVQTDVTEQSKLLMIVDEVISDLMRKILHHPQFQALESAWRGAYFLVRNVETDTNLKIYLQDISKQEAIDNLKSVDNLEDSSLFQIIEAGAIGASGREPWSIICGNYTFSLNVDDAALLIRLSKISANVNTPFISYVEPIMFEFKSFGAIEDFDVWRVSEDESVNKLWTALRSLPEASYIGLALPRFLTRLPYGEHTEPTENFYFEEFLKSVPHEKYLWSNPAFVCASLLAQTFSNFGWNILQNLVLDVQGLPIHSYLENDEVKIKPCAEIIISEKNYERISNQGLMPLISFYNSDRVRLGRFQSIAQPSSTLKGKWS